MITVRLKGGLGNQMFQYAFGRAMAKRNDDALALDLTYLLDRRPRSDHVFRDLDLDIFAIPVLVTRLSRAARSVPIPYVWLGMHEAWRRLRMLSGRERLVREGPGFRLDEVPERGDVFLDGYWQDEKLFANVHDEIRATFRSLAPIPEASQGLADEIAQSDAVCVNVRRGDFVHHPGSARTHGFVGLEYYQRAMEVIETKVKDPHVFVFSDDMTWCRENLRFEHPSTYVGHDHAGNRFGRYLALMMACKHFVIPNSTFGWWAAWLSTHTEKTVVAPRRWYAASPGLSDPVPPGWIRV